MAWKIPRSSSMIWEMIFAADHVSLNGKPWVFHISLLVYRVIPCSLRNQSWQWKIHQHPQSKWTKCSCENHRTKWGIVELSSHVWLPDGIWKIGYSIPEFSDQFINHPQTSRDPVLKVIECYRSVPEQETVGLPHLVSLPHFGNFVCVPMSCGNFTFFWLTS